MSGTYHFGAFQPVLKEMVKTGMPVGEALAVALAQNTAWLAEAIRGEPVSSEGGYAGSDAHNHNGENSAFLQQVQMVYRGLVRGCESTSALQSGVTCQSDERKPLPFLRPALVSGDPTLQADGLSSASRAYSWLPCYALPIVPGPYLRYVRLRVQAGNKSGTNKARIYLAARQPGAALTVTRTGEDGIGGFREWEACSTSVEVTAGAGNLETVALCLDLRPELPTSTQRNFQFNVAQPMYVSLWSECDPGVTMIVGDSLALPHTGPCLALTTR